MSIGAKILNLGMRLSGMKKKYALPEEEFLQEVRKMNKTRGFYMPKDHKAVYREHLVMGRQVLIVQPREQQAQRAILYFFGGGMMIGPDRGDVDVIVKLAQGTGCDIWFPMYPLCIDHCIIDAYEMAYACYKEMIERYGAGNVSTCGFSSGAALAIGVAAYNNTMTDRLPVPRHIVAVSPGEVPWTEEERQIMRRNNPYDMMVDYAFMERVEKYERQGRDDIPEFMIHISKGDYTGIKHIHFVWSTDEVLYGAKENFLNNCRKYGVEYTVRERPGMIHCYAMLPYFKEAKEDFAEIVSLLAQ